MLSKCTAWAGRGRLTRGQVTVMRGRSVALLMGLLIVVATVGCSSSSDEAVGGGSPDTTARVRRSVAHGPVATVAGPLTGGKGVFVGAATPAGPAARRGRLHRDGVHRGRHRHVVRGARRAADRWHLRTGAGNHRGLRDPHRRPPARGRRRTSTAPSSSSGSTSAAASTPLPTTPTSPTSCLREGLRLGRRVGPAHRHRGRPGRRRGTRCARRRAPARA